jgi:predicted transcriptional regulator of viral defense system
MYLLNQLQQLGEVPFSNGLIKTLLADYRRPNDKISEWLGDQTLIPIKRGLYVLNPKTTGRPISLPLIANLLYGPSYVSLDFALSYYGLIPEVVHEITSVTTGRTKTYDTPVGRFSYEHASLKSYPLGIASVANESGHFFLMATPEKALCDKLMQTSNLRINNVTTMLDYFEQDLRLDLDEFSKFDLELLKRIAAVAIKPRLIRVLCNTLEYVVINPAYVELQKYITGSGGLYD